MEPLRNFSLALFAFVLLSSAKAPLSIKYMDIHFKNNTNEELHVALNYWTYDTDRQETFAWYVLQPGETKFLARDKYNDFWWYADTPRNSSGNRLEWKGKNAFSIDGETFYFRYKQPTIDEVQDNGDGTYSYTHYINY